MDFFNYLRNKADKDPAAFSEFKKELQKIQDEKRPNALPVRFHIDLNDQEMAELTSQCKYAYKPDNKGFANNASAIINLLANGCVTFAKWGIVTGKEFTPGGAHQDAIILTKKQKKSINDFSPNPTEVLAEIMKREADPDQKENLKTATAALRATHDQDGGVFSDKVVAKQTIAAYEGSLLAPVAAKKELSKDPSKEEKIAQFKQEWEHNKKLQGQPVAFQKSSQLLGKLFSDKSISDEAVLKFLQDIHIKPAGGFFTDNKGQPTPLANLLSQERPQVSSAFTGKVVSGATLVASPSNSPKAPPRAWVEKASSVDPSIPDNTANKYKTKTGAYTTERQKVHKGIKAQIVGKSQPVPLHQKPVAVIMMGPPGAGKSMAISQITKGSDQFVEVGMDNVMERLPEYQKAINLGTDKDGKIITAKDACVITRREAIDITANLREEVIHSRRNMIYESPGQNLDLYKEMIAKLKKAGYEVQVYYLDVDVEQAKQRASDRAERTGRLVQDGVIESFNAKAKANFKEIAQMADTALMLDNRDPPPKQACKYEHGNLTEGEQYLKQRGFLKDTGQPTALKSATAIPQKQTGGGAKEAAAKAAATDTATKASGADKTAKPLKHNFTTEQIDKWLFGNKAGPAPGFPTSQLAIKQKGVRKQADYAPKTTFSEVKMMSDGGKYTSRMAIYNGSITDIKADPGQKVAIGDSNNGDLLTGCGYAIATAVINAAGPNLQRDLYNQFGVPGVMQVPEGAKEYTQKAYGGSEGRGYAITCDAHDMKATHNIARIEFMTVPMHDEAGVRNMYREAFEHSKDLDYIVMPMAGMSHPVLDGKPALSAQIATEEFQKFVDKYPESKLKVVYTIYQNPVYENLYTAAAKKLDPVPGV